MALDTPDAVASLTLMDVVPTHHLLDTLPKAVAKAYYHWFFLAQPSPFPETLIGRDPDFFYESCLLGWGRATLEAFDQTALDHYRTAWRDPATIRAMCNDYRAALEVDFAHDAADLGRQVACPALVLYGEEGAMAINYDVGRAWRARLTDMQVRPMPGGHFFVDASPTETLAALLPFLAAQPAP
jgi:haloacetate dehalogenase